MQTESMYASESVCISILGGYFTYISSPRVDFLGETAGARKRYEIGFLSKNFPLVLSAK